MLADFHHAPLRSLRKNSADLLGLVLPPTTIELGNNRSFLHHLSDNFTDNIAEHGRINQFANRPRFAR